MGVNIMVSDCISTLRLLNSVFVAISCALDVTVVKYYVVVAHAGSGVLNPCCFEIERIHLIHFVTGVIKGG